MDMTNPTFQPETDANYHPFGQDDADEPRFVCPASFNPLYIENIAAKVLSFLSVEELKVCRLVCSLWAEEGARHLFRRAFVLLNKFEDAQDSSNVTPSAIRFLHPSYKSEDDANWTQNNIEAVSECTNTLRQFLAPLENRPNQLGQIKVFLETDQRSSSAWRILSQDEKFAIPGLAARVHTLKFPQNIRILDDYARLPLLLDKCVNLRVLDTTEIDVSGYERHFLKEYQGDQEKALEKLDIFLGRLSSLQQIHCTPFSIREVRLREYARFPQAFQAITFLDIQEKLVPLFLQLSANLRWALMELTLALDPMSNKDNIRQFLQLFARSLKILSIEWEKERGVVVPSSLATPWSDDWFIPLSLSQLEFLKIRYTSVDEGVDIWRWRTLAVALQLPKLKKLSTNSGWPCSLVREEIRRWEVEENNSAEVLSSSRRKLKSESIEELEMVRVRDSHRISLDYGALFPGLKSLAIEFETTVPLRDNTSLFKEWAGCGLERLDLDFRVLDYASCRECAQWLTGLPVPPPEVYQNEQVSPEQSKEQAKLQAASTSIRDLTNLKSLAVRGPRLAHNGLVLGDFFIYNCLIFMKRLQSAQLYNAWFTPKGLRDLKESLGNNTSLTGGYIIPHSISNFPQITSLLQKLHLPKLSG